MDTQIDVTIDEVVGHGRTYAGRVFELELQVSRLLAERAELRDANTLLSHRIVQLAGETIEGPLVDLHSELDESAPWSDGAPTASTV